MKKVDFERQLSVSMEDGGIRVIPLVSESVRVLAIDYRILSDRRVLTFSLHGVWKCLRTPQPFGAWSKAVLERMTEGVEFWPSADGSDVYVDVALGRLVVAGLKAKHLSRISAALDAAAARAEADRTGSFAEMAPDVSELFAGDPQPIGFAGLLNVEERDFGGLAVGVVNGRELYILLSSKRFFTTWIEGHIRRLSLRINVDYLKDNFKDANHSRVVRQYFLTEHAARGICLIDDSPASEAVRSYLGIVPAAADDAKKSVRRSKGSKRNAKQCVDVASAAEQPELPEMTSPGVDASQSVGGSAVGSAGSCLSVVTGSASPAIVGLPIYPFEFRGRLVRVVLKGTSPWFVGVDVCLAIGIARLNTAVRPLSLAYMCVETIRGSRGIQRFMLLSEAGVLEIASRSVKPAAQAFAHWVRSTSFIAQALAQSADAAAGASAVSADSNDGGHSDGLLADAEDGRDGLADQSLPEEASNEVAFGGTRFVPIAGGFAGILPYSERDVGGTITKVVSARDLHELLRVANVFPTWIERAIARLGLERDIDYVRDTFKGTGSCRRVRQYFLTERAARRIVFAVNPPVGVAVLNHLRAVLSAERSEVEKSGSDQAASGGVSAAEDVVESGLVSGSEVEIAAEVVLESGEPESSRMSGNELPEEKAIDGVEQETSAVDVNVDQGSSSISSKFDGPWFGPDGDVSGGLVGMMPCQGGSYVSLEDASVGPVLEFRGVLIRTFRAGGRIWFVVEDLCGSVGCPAYGVLADMDIALDDQCYFEMPDWAICWCALSANGARRFALKLWTRESQALYLWLEDEAIPALVHMENVETMQKNKAASADLGDEQGKEPVAPSFVCSPATLPLTMEEFLRVMGVPETMARAEAVVREAELALDVMGHGVEAAGFRHPATGAWLFHRSILVEWWAKAAATVAASIRSRFS